MSNSIDSRIRLLEELHTKANSLFELGSQSTEFGEWHKAVTNALRDCLGEDSFEFPEFANLLFELPSAFKEADERMRKNTRIISRDKDNVTRLQTLQQAIEDGKKRMAELGIKPTNSMFENALCEAQSILRMAIVEMRRSEKK
jgi:hypothetical protein